MVVLSEGFDIIMLWPATAPGRLTQSRGEELLSVPARLHALHISKLALHVYNMLVIYR